MANIKPTDRPDLAQWRVRHELRRSSAASPVRSGKEYRRKEKYGKRSW